MPPGRRINDTKNRRRQVPLSLRPAPSQGTDPDFSRKKRGLPLFS